MSRKKSISGWSVSEDDAKALAELRLALGLKNMTIADAIGMNEGSFSQAFRGVGNRGFAPEARDNLQDFLKTELENFSSKAELDEKKRPNLKKAKRLFTELFETNKSDRRGEYQEPRGVLPLNCPNYVERAVDLRIERILHSSVQAICVMGGPRSGKSSLVERIRYAALAMGRDVQFVDVFKYWSDQGEGRPKNNSLELSDILNAIAYALSETTNAITTSDEDHHFQIPKFQKWLGDFTSRSPDTVFILENLNLLLDYVVRPKELGQLIYCLTSYTVRRDNCLIVMPDDGAYLGADKFLSETVSRAEIFSTVDISISDIESLAAQVLGKDQPVSQNIYNKLFEAFGGCIFLHHAVFHLVRTEQSDKPLNQKSLEERVSRSIRYVLDIFEASASPDSITDQLEREIARLRERVYSRITILEKIVDDSEAEAGGSLLNILASGDVRPGDTQYSILRALEWAGFVCSASTVPDHIKALARSKANQR